MWQIIITSLEFKAVAMTAGGRSFSNLYGACHLNDGLCELGDNQQSWIKIRNGGKKKATDDND